jgi:hypothetical protein
MDIYLKAYQRVIPNRGSFNIKTSTARAARKGCGFFVFFSLTITFMVPHKTR